jgi:L-histidine N-alpha-methyltransferase
MDPDFAIVEFGSGSSSKTRLLIRAALKNQRSLVYTPIDISGKFLRKCGRALVRDFSRLHIAGIAGEYRAALNALAPSVSARLFVFLGSNLGNFDPEQSCAFLSSVAARMGPKDKLLVGVDLAKDRSVLERAYDDASGVTSQFNKNLLARINRELGGSFDLGAFDHEARYVREKGRIEMRLVSKRRQRVRVASLGRRFEFLQGERILTEVSYKYSVPGLDALFEGSGLARERLWCDGLGRFADVVVSRTP